MPNKVFNVMINPNKDIQNGISTEKKLVNLLKKTVLRFEKDAHDDRFYPQISEAERILDRNYFTDEVRLLIEQGIDKVSGKASGMHSVEMYVRYPKSNVYTVQSLAYGSKKEVLETLKNESFIKKFIERVRSKSEKLEDSDLQSLYH